MSQEKKFEPANRLSAYFEASDHYMQLALCDPIDGEIVHRHGVYPRTARGEKFVREVIQQYNLKSENRDDIKFVLIVVPWEPSEAGIDRITGN